MKNQNVLVLDEMRKLISRSVKSSETNYISLYKALLKFNFDTVDVSIDFDNKQVYFIHSRNTLNGVSALFELSETYAVPVNYTNLEETLKGCLNGRENSIRFYKSLLFKYNNVAAALDTPAISA